MLRAESGNTAAVERFTGRWDGDGGRLPKTKDAWKVYWKPISQSKYMVFPLEVITQWEDIHCSQRARVFKWEKKKSQSQPQDAKNKMKTRFVFTTVVVVVSPDSL